MKEYKKPEIHIEKFTLSKHIAACAFDMSNLKDKETCTAIGDAVGDPFNVPPIELFTNANVNCKEIDSNWLDYCYTNGAHGSNTFNS